MPKWSRKRQRKLLAGRPNPRARCEAKTTRSPASGAGTTSPAYGTQHATKSGDRRQPRSQRSAICSCAMVEPLHVMRGPTGSAIEAGCGGGE